MESKGKPPWIAHPTSCPVSSGSYWLGLGFRFLFMVGSSPFPACCKYHFYASHSHPHHTFPSTSKGSRCNVSLNSSLAPPHQPTRHLQGSSLSQALQCQDESAQVTGLSAVGGAGPEALRLPPSDPELYAVPVPSLWVTQGWSGGWRHLL